ncbi:MAG: molybdopterin-dependent oxidoreductase [Actinomycetota bacterium]|nr:MAG: oxidoreductase molybdopterin binding [Actinomycetota bacterium]MDO8949369.1 molybdopterin-dependent oxidoreductase [Actinomycetota bacterium]MDP3629380.1 molybdopterin-dependent oxidoreductase [Actinomycetota bacterium]
MRMRMRLIAVILLIAAVLTGCSGPATGGGPQNAPRGDVTRLDGVQIREYKGEKLGSVDDFRENSIKGPQQVDRETYRLRVKGLVNAPRDYTYSQITSGHAAYEKVVQLDCVEGWSVKVLWQGILVSDLIKEVGAKGSANTVIFRAADGYSTSLPLSYIEDNAILLAYRMNGVTLPAERGFPLQLVAEDKWGYKWAKWITEIELSDDPAYRGYWESRGYSNSGDRDKSSRGD